MPRTIQLTSAGHSKLLEALKTFYADQVATAPSKRDRNVTLAEIQELIEICE